MISNSFFRLALLSIVLATTACSTTNRDNVKTYSTEASADFSDTKTYRWDFSGMESTVPEGGHTQEFNRVVCEHVDMLMNDRGFKRVAQGDADITLDYRVVVTQEEAVEDSTADIDNTAETDNDYGLRWTFDKDELPAFQGLQAPKDQTTLYRRGTLHIAAFNSQGQAIWHSSSTRILEGRSNEAERRAALRIAVDKIMKTFPVKPEAQ